jgi:predicted unusual protein kinase regulating ubiquinone biosynthesis (AarF/ABC1/UbiB family)
MEAPVVAAAPASVRGNRRVRQAVADGLVRWRASQDGRANFRYTETALGPLSGPSATFPGGNGRDQASAVIGSMPRRQQMIRRSSDTAAPLLFDKVVFEAGLFTSLLRLARWIYVLSSVLSGNLWDRILRRDSVTRRAIRVREALERVGGTFVKLGQQAAMRIDLIPWEYCLELSKMLDKMPPFPLEDALAAIERTTGRPWDEVFAFLDPEPVGSASVACVYQAILRDGTKVAVKIRRPGVGETFAADFRVLDWLTRFIEFLTILRPGFTRNLRTELRDTLMEELDFTKEARFQDVFRRNAKKSGLNYLSAPKVYFDLSESEMIVQEFVTGMWLWEVIAAVEHKDPVGLAMLSEMNIKPKRVAKRIMWSAFWSMDENLFFHADPHPANILVQRDDKLVFVDFGSCGSFNDEKRVALERIVLALRNGDAEAMARSTLNLLEPLPAVDVPAIMKEAEELHTRVLSTFRTKAKYTEWWERTSARQWMTLVRVARKFNVPINLHTLRMIRATLLYDTLVLRLNPKADRYREYARFMKHRATLVRKKFQRQLRKSPRDILFLRLEELMETGDDILLAAQQMVSSPVLNFGSMVDKWVFSASILSRLAGRLLILTLLALVATAAMGNAGAELNDWRQLFATVLTNGVFLFLVAVLVILNFRQIYLRLRDHDT